MGKRKRKQERIDPDLYDANIDLEERKDQEDEEAISSVISGDEFIKEMDNLFGDFDEPINNEDIESTIEDIIRDFIKAEL